MVSLSLENQWGWNGRDGWRGSKGERERLTMEWREKRYRNERGIPIESIIGTAIGSLLVRSPIHRIAEETGRSYEIRARLLVSLLHANSSLIVTISTGYTTTFLWYQCCHRRKITIGIFNWEINENLIFFV